VVDLFVGTKRNDRLAGTDGRDTLSGKDGKDRLTGGLGDDVLTGGRHSDRFVFRTGDGRDTINDFDAVGKTHDILDLSGLASIESFKDLKKNHLDQDGKHLVIEGLDGDEIVLRNIKVNDLDVGDCLF
jgi:Ca2+-binding RTX toxin-like protein